MRSVSRRQLALVSNIAITKCGRIRTITPLVPSRKGIGTRGTHESAGLLTTSIRVGTRISPAARVMRAANVGTEIVVLSRWTEPSAKRAFDPAGWNE